MKRLALIIPMLAAHSAPGSEQGDFRAYVAPILRARCLGCHGTEARTGGLSLASAKGIQDGGESGPAVEPGKPEESLLYEMIVGDPPEMPRKGGPLTPDQVATIRRWIEGGADWPADLVLDDSKTKQETRWSLRPLVRPEVPRVANAGWVRNPIDAFILHALEEKGLFPRPEADRRTLIRRLTYDLHGLPPTPEEIDGFIGDPSPEAYERLVDRLLASTRFGERWARHWLDVVHYGDTHGYDKDKRRDHAWPYRDFVIQSFNEDTPYARFVRKQMAGEVLSPGDPDARTAIGRPGG